MAELTGAEAELASGEERFLMIFEQAPVGITRVAPDGRFLWINRKFCDIVGYTVEEMMTRTFQDITHPEDLAADLAYVRKMLDGEIETYSMEKRYIRKDNSIVWINLTVSIVHEDTGEPRHFIAVVEDITERRKLENHLRESEARSRILVENAPDGIFVVDAATGRFVDSNSRGLEMFGYTRDELFSFTPVDFSPPLAPDGRPVTEVLEERLKSLEPGKQITFEWIHLHADGHEIPCEVRAVLLPAQGRPLLRASMTDITERKELEKVLKDRLQFQRLVSGIASRFNDLSGEDFEKTIQETLTEIGGYFDADSVKLYRLSLEGEVLKLRINWRTEGLAPPGEMSELLKKNYRGFAAHYSQGETLLFDSSHECPPWPGMRETMEFLGVKAGLGVPLETDDSGVDVFAMDKIEADYTWPVDILKHAEAIGRILLGAMRRSEAEADLHKSYNEIKQLKARLEQENIYLRKEMELLESHEEIVGKSQAIKSVLGQAEQVAGQETPVLILGETGTGKELLARAIHKLSPRKARSMIVINCAALSPTLIEGELFGREKGAYTGALTKQAGRFEIADKSTVFLDEIGDLPLELQAKLLRVLQEGQFERLGSTKTLTVDVRVVAATNQDLEEAVQEGRFRKDLFYRLSVFPITMPPLRERSEDIPLLTWFFVREFGERMGKTVEKLSKKSMDTMQAYSWPGNVRELRNVVERAMILHTGQTLRIDIAGKPKQEALQPVSLEEVERNHITSILAKAKGKVSGRNGAAEMLGLKESTLRARMGKLGIRRKW